MSTPLFYILAPFGLAFGLFAVYLIVSLFLKDPARPFRMFGAPPIKGEEGESAVVEAMEDKGRRAEGEEEAGAEETEGK